MGPATAQTGAPAAGHGEPGGGAQAPLPGGGAESEHVDVLIVGAGLSGVGAACHLARRLPHKRVAILEAREAIGGTWDLFRYPGIRSDSDMFTLGYRFAPWRDPKAIADGASILSYIRRTAAQHGVQQLIRCAHKVTRAEWSSETERWTVHAQRTDTGETVTLTCDFLYACTGYYSYEEGYSPQLPGIERFGGQIVHPQSWPEDLDWAGRRVVVIGSGATAVTLVPALAEKAAHVTMLQRSPTYIISVPGRDQIADYLRRKLPAPLAHSAARWKNVLLGMASFQLSRRTPQLMRRLLRNMALRQLPEGYDVDTHFNPTYNPWDQRLCLVPDGDLFKAIRAGRATVATDTIDTFTQDGIRLRSGEHLDADVVITATGLNLLFLGGIELFLDGRPVKPPETVAYKGMMFCGVPNMALTLGYTNASWTLKADLVAEYVCRVLAAMEARGATVCTPQPPDPSLPTEPIIDLRSGYVLRSISELPRQGARAPWRLHQNYIKDVRLLRRGPVDDGLVFSASRAARAAAAPERAIAHA